jgi:hypothetical protein
VSQSHSELLNKYILDGHNRQWVCGFDSDHNHCLILTTA